MKIIRHELRPVEEGSRVKMCRICGERFPHRTAGLMLIQENSVLDVGISEGSANIIDFYRHNLAEFDVVSCQPPRPIEQPWTIHRTVKTPLHAMQVCYDCGLVLASRGHLSEGDVYQTHSQLHAFIGRKSTLLNKYIGRPELTSAKRCRPEKPMKILHWVAATHYRDTQECIGCRKVISNSGTHFAPGTIMEDKSRDEGDRLHWSPTDWSDGAWRHGGWRRCTPREKESIVIHRVGVYTESGHGKTRDPQRCLDCGIQISQPGRVKVFPPGDVFQSHGQIEAFIAPTSPTLQKANFDVENAKRCQPQEPIPGFHKVASRLSLLVLHRVSATPTTEPQRCFDCAKVLSESEPHFPAGTIMENQSRDEGDRCSWSATDIDDPRWRKAGYWRCTSEEKNKVIIHRIGDQGPG